MTFPQLSQDILIFLALLQTHQVKYLIIGGVAVIYHGYPRYTGDIDIFYDRDRKNVEKLYAALLEFWDGDIPALKNSQELEKPGVIVQFGLPPNRIDLINKIDGLTFAEAAVSPVTANLPNEQTNTMIGVPIINRRQLLVNKQALSRPKDKDDFQQLNPEK